MSLEPGEQNEASLSQNGVKAGKKRKIMNVRPILYHEGQYEAPSSSLMKAAGCEEPVERSPTSKQPEAGVPGTGTLSVLCFFFGKLVRRSWQKYLLCLYSRDR